MCVIVKSSPEAPAVVRWCDAPVVTAHEVSLTARDQAPELARRALVPGDLLDVTRSGDCAQMCVSSAGEFLRKVKLRPTGELEETLDVLRIGDIVATCDQPQ